MTVDIR